MTSSNTPTIPHELIVAGARALNEGVEPPVFHQAAEGHPHAEEELAEIVLDGVANASGFNGLMALAGLILEQHYPEDIFTGRERRETSDPGHQLVQALRACEDAMKERPHG